MTKLDDQFDALPEDQRAAFRFNTTRWLTILVVAVAGYVVLWWFPNHQIQTEHDRAWDCVDKLEKTGVGDARSCEANPWFARLVPWTRHDALAAGPRTRVAMLALDLAELALAAEDSSAAGRWIEIALEDKTLEADALHLLGRVHEMRDEREEMIAAWKKVRALDAAAPAPDVSISEDEVERIASAALDLLPAEVKDKLANVPIMIDELPSDALVDEGTDPRLLGLFQGTPMADDLAPVVTTILLFKRNLERVSIDLDQLADEITITVLHETAHYFGLEEADLERIGLD